MNNRFAAMLLPALVLAAVFAAHPARAQDAPRADSLGAYELSMVDRMPELANRSAAAAALNRNYPPELRRRHETGVVTLRFLLQRNGTVDSTRISVENASAEGFNEAAVRVVQTMRFRPARLGGEPVPVWVTLPVAFFTGPSLPPPTRAPGDARPPRR